MSYVRRPGATGVVDPSPVIDLSTGRALREGVTGGRPEVEEQGRGRRDRGPLTPKRAGGHSSRAERGREGRGT